MSMLTILLSKLSGPFRLGLNRNLETFVCSRRTVRALAVVVICQLLIVPVHCMQLGQYDVQDCAFPKQPFINSSTAILEKLSKFVGKSYSTDDSNLHPIGAITYYEVGVCVVPTKYKNEDGLKTAGALQLLPDSPESPHILGDMRHTQLMAGNSWLSIEYEEGHAYHTHCNKEARRTKLMITCSPGQSQGILRLIEENNNKTVDCYYLFELEHEAICEDARSSGLGVGSIVTIVFLSLVGVYLIGGFLYQRFVMGAKGLEQFPNYHFWHDFGNLQADGCDLICRGGLGRRSTSTYRGVGDDQLNNSSTDHEEYSSTTARDDDLLPM